MGYNNDNNPYLLTNVNNKTIKYSNNMYPISYGIYDDNDNLINGYSYSFNGNKLSEIYDKTNNRKIKFKYDSSGKRIEKEVYSYLTLYSIITTYYYENDKLIKEVIFNEGSDESRVINYIYDGDMLIGIEYNNKIWYYLKNINGLIIGLVNSDGVVEAKYNYTAYGEIKVFNNSGNEELNSSFIGNINPLRYKGYYYDVETGLFWLSSRYYSPELCRFISPDDVEYLDPSSINGLNLYAYCGNDPINRYDPTGHAWDVILDIFSIGWSLYDFIKDPSWENFGWLALDVVFAVVPFLTGSSIMKAASKLDDVSDIGGYMNKFDNVYDSIVIGNDMGRVTNLAFDTGSMIYDGYKPMNALYAMGRADEITDAMRYAAKVDNAGFIMDKYKAGYKIINAGSDGRGFFKMMKSAYGMELKILYRLKYGNKLHKLWWILNSGRRIIW